DLGDGPAPVGADRHPGLAGGVDRHHLVRRVAAARRHRTAPAPTDAAGARNPGGAVRQGGGLPGGVPGTAGRAAGPPGRASTRASTRSSAARRMSLLATPAPQRFEVARSIGAERRSTLALLRTLPATAFDAPAT